MEGKSNYSKFGVFAGKNVSPRLLELEENFKKNGGEFKKIKLVELFNYKRGTRITKQNRNQGKYPLITAGESFNGVKGYIDAGSNEIFCDAITVDMFCNVFLQCGEFCCDDNILVLKSKNKLTNEVLLYLCAAIARSKPLFSYAHQYRQKDLVKHILILPVYYDGELAFDYMEQYVRELEAERVRELEAYLLASGLNDYQLTDNERKILIEMGGVNTNLRRLRLVIYLKNYLQNFLLKELINLKPLTLNMTESIAYQQCMQNMEITALCIGQEKVILLFIKMYFQLFTMEQLQLD